MEARVGGRAVRVGNDVFLLITGPVKDSVLEPGVFYFSGNGNILRIYLEQAFPFLHRGLGETGKLV